MLEANYVIEQMSINKTFAELQLSSKEGTRYKAILKDNVDLFIRTFKIGDHISCKVKERKVDNETILDIYQIKKSYIGIKLNLDVDVLKKKFDVLISSVKDKDYKNILEAFFDENIKIDFFNYPAAVSKHHCYQYGLLEHSIEVTEIALNLSKYLKNISNDLIITGGLLHDIGKLKAYDFNNETGAISRTDLDDLVGHLSMSALFLSKTIPEDTDSEKAILLYNAILSHHGKLEWGSPVNYRTKEAYLIHQADMLSSRMNNLNSLKSESANWTEEDKLEKRKWYIHG